jgi:hypothetical protein
MFVDELSPPRVLERIELKATEMRRRLDVICWHYSTRDEFLLIVENAGTNLNGWELID